jgi:hypothetical protein
MNRTLQPWEFLLITLSGWMNRHQQRVIDYLIEENRILKRKFCGKRIRCTDNERRRLAVKAKALGRKLLEKVASVASPDMILAWYRKLIAKKWDYSSKRGPGRPRVMAEIADLTVKMARENPGWGYTRIRDALANLKYKVSRTSIANILKEEGEERPGHVSEIPLGEPCSSRLFHSGSRHSWTPCDVLCAYCPGPIDPPRSGGGVNSRARYSIHDTGWPEPDRYIWGLFGWKTLPHHGSRQEILREISKSSGGIRDECPSIAAEITQSERLCRAIHPINQTGVP